MNRSDSNNCFFSFSNLLFVKCIFIYILSLSFIQSISAQDLLFDDELPFPSYESPVYTPPHIGEGCNGTIECWLQTLNFTISHVETPIPGLMNATLSNFTCTDISLGGMHGESITPNDPSLHIAQYNLTVSDASVVCEGFLHFNLTVFPYVKDFVKMKAVVSKTNIDYSVVFGTDDQFKISNATQNGCSITPHIDVTFEGSMTAIILNLIKKPLIDFITVQVDTTMCEMSRNMTNITLTNAIESFNNLTEAAFFDYDPLPDVTDDIDKKSVNIMDNFLMKTVDKLFNGDGKTSKGFFGDDRNIKCLVEALTSDDENRVVVDLNITESIDLLNTLVLNLTLNTVTISGLDSIHDVRVLYNDYVARHRDDDVNINDRYLIDNILMADNITIALNITVDLYSISKIIGSGLLTKNIQLDLGAGNMDARLALRPVFLDSPLYNVTVGDLLFHQNSTVSSSCMSALGGNTNDYKAGAGLNVDTLNLLAKYWVKVEGDYDGTLERNLNQIMSELVDIPNVKLNEYLTLLFSGVTNNIIRNATNHVLPSLANDSNGNLIDCLDNVDYNTIPGEPLNWNHSAIMKLVKLVVDDLFANGRTLNAFFKCRHTDGNIGTRHSVHDRYSTLNYGSDRIFADLSSEALVEGESYQSLSNNDALEAELCDKTDDTCITRRKETVIDHITHAIKHTSSTFDYTALVKSAVEALRAATPMSEASLEMYELGDVLVDYSIHSAASLNHLQFSSQKNDKIPNANETILFADVTAFAPNSTHMYPLRPIPPPTQAYSSENVSKKESKNESENESENESDNKSENESENESENGENTHIQLMDSLSSLHSPRNMSANGAGDLFVALTLPISHRIFNINATIFLDTLALSTGVNVELHKDLLARLSLRQATSFCLFSAIPDISAFLIAYHIDTLKIVLDITVDGYDKVITIPFIKDDVADTINNLNDFVNRYFPNAIDLADTQIRYLVPQACNYQPLVAKPIVETLKHHPLANKICYSIIFSMFCLIGLWCLFIVLCTNCTSLKQVLHQRGEGSVREKRVFVNDHLSRLGFISVSNNPYYGDSRKSLPNSASTNGMNLNDSDHDHLYDMNDHDSCDLVLSASDLMPTSLSIPNISHNSKNTDKPLPTQTLDLISHSSFVSSPSLPLYLRYGILVCLLINVFLFVLSNVTNGAAVTITVDALGARFDLGTLFDFTLINTAEHMYVAGVYFIFFLIVFFSGFCPYVKLLLMFYVWLSDLKRLTLKKRETLLIWLDRLGKWSLIDAFVLVLMLVALRFHLDVFKGFDFHIHVRSDPGFFLFLLATIVSLILSHVLLWVHHEIVKLPIPDYSEPNSPNSSHTVNNSSDSNLSSNPNAYIALPLSVCRFQHAAMTCVSSEVNTLVSKGVISSDQVLTADLNNALEDPNSQYLYNNENMTVNSDKLAENKYLLLVSFSIFGSVVVFLSLIFSAAFLFYGVVIPTFRFDFIAFAGYLLGENNIVQYSVVTVGKAITTASRTVTPGVIWIQVVFFLFALIMPSIYIIIATTLWIIPFSLKIQLILHHIAQVAIAWSGVEVFILSVAAACIQISDFAKFIVGFKLAFADDIFAEYFSDLLNGHGYPFDLIAVLKNGALLLFLSSILFLGFGYLVSNIQLSCLKDREAIFCGKDQSYYVSRRLYEDCPDKPLNENQVSLIGDVSDKGSSGRKISLNNRVFLTFLCFLKSTCILDTHLQCVSPNAENHSEKYKLE